MQRARRTLAIVWAAIPPLVLSALIHSTDPDVGGIAGLARPWTLASVVVFAIPLLGAAMLCLRFLVGSGRGAALALAAVASFVAAFGLTLLQSRAGTWLDDAWTVTGGSLLVFAVLTLAVVPAAALGWRRRHADDTP